MNIAMIAAVGKHLELGKNNDLIWHFKEDMRFFRETTRGATVVMGRKTFESLPAALPGRRNIVITKNAAYHAENAEVVGSMEQALEIIKNDEKVFIIGGASIYKVFLPYAHKIFLTEIDDECTDADTFFPDFDKSLYKKEILNSIQVNNVTLNFTLYSKKDCD